MINKNDLQNIEEEVIESITNKQLEKLEKKMIEDKLNSKQYCEYFIEYEEKTSKMAKKQIIANISNELKEAEYNFNIYDDLILIFIGDSELQEVELEAYVSMLKFDRKVKQCSALLKNEVKKAINKCKDYSEKLKEKENNEDKEEVEEINEEIEKD